MTYPIQSGIPIPPPDDIEQPETEPSILFKADEKGARIHTSGLPCSFDPEGDTVLVEWLGGSMYITGYSSLGRGELL